MSLAGPLPLWPGRASGCRPRQAPSAMLPDATRQLAESKIGHTFSDPRLLEQALTHASVAQARVRSNERMEFLGDAVLGLVACQRIYELYPHLLEGEMTKIKSTVVSRQCCAQITRELGLEDLLSIGKGMRVHEQLPTSLAAAVLESIIAALYLDSGLETARRFLLPRIEPLIDKAFDSGHQENFKSILQQHAQQHMEGVPAYLVLEQKGPDHAKHFHVCVQIGERRFAPCWGQSKKAAEQQAALLALHELGVTAADPDGRVRVLENKKPDKNGKPAPPTPDQPAAPPLPDEPPPPPPLTP